MKNIGILTFHRAFNYGAVWQAYALRRTFISLNCKCDIINYSSYIDEDYNIMPRYKGSVKEFIFNFFRIYPKFMKKRKFIRFYKKFLNVDFNNIVDRNLLNGLNEIYDLFVSGSDQVFNLKLTNADKTYFLDFVTDSSKKFSYSASFGLADLDTEDKQLYAMLLAGFKKISVREIQGKKIIKDLLNIETNITLDPSFLLDKETWKEIALPNKYSDYILLYTISLPDRILKFAENLSKITGYKLVFITSALKRTIKADYIICTPEQWLGYFLNAKYIVTNSFHGTSFAINFNKKFFVDLFSETPMASVNSRIENILKLFQLEDRLIDNIKYNYNKEINYEAANKILELERKKSIDYLKAIIE